MALTKISTDGISDDAVTTDKLANAINTARDANTAKTTNATHSGEVTGATALTIADNVVDEANLKVSNSPTNGYFLSAQSGNTGGLTWAQVSTDLVADTSPQLGGDLASNGNNINIADNDIIVVGTGNDLQISHTSNVSQIRGATANDIKIISAANFHLQHADTDGSNAESMIEAFGDGAVKLFHDNSQKLETTSWGTQIYGALATTGNLDCATDSAKIKAGAGGDIELFHNGTNNYLDSLGSAIFYNRPNADWYVSDYTSNENRIKAIKDGAVELYHNGVKRFETDTDGVRVVAPEGAQAMLRLIGDEGDDNNDYFRLNAGGGTLKLQDASNGSSWEDNIVINAAGSVELYHDNSKKLETYSGGVRLDGELLMQNNSVYLNDSAKLRIGTGQDLELYHDGTNSYFTSKTGALIIRNTINNAIHLGTNNSDRWYVYDVGHFIPAANNAYNIGSTSYRVANIYTNDLHLSNEGHSNDVDGTWGSFTIQEGAEDLFLVNKRNGKKYKFNLTEVL